MYSATTCTQAGDPTDEFPYCCPEVPCGTKKPNSDPDYDTTSNILFIFIYFKTKHFKIKLIF